MFRKLRMMAIPIATVLLSWHNFFQPTDAFPQVTSARPTRRGRQRHLALFSSSQLQIVDNIDRVFVLSDLHTDHAANQEWLEDKIASSDMQKTDLVVVAGDISHDLDTFRSSMEVMTERTNVVFVPGNHEAWLNSRDIEREEYTTTSLDKLDEVYRLCKEMGVYTKPVLFRKNEDSPHPLWVIPLESWYDGSLSKDFDQWPELTEDFDRWPWVDFLRCQWPESLGGSQEGQGRIPMGLVNYFLKRNEPLLKQTTTEMRNPGIMTVSHFAPNKYCLPDWKDLTSTDFQWDWLDHGGAGMSAKFSKVAGTDLLDKQIRKLFNNGEMDDRERLIHVFGHSHRPKDFEYKSIRYIHNPLGKPRERQLHMVSPEVDFQLVWDTTIGEVPGETVLRYWEEQGGGLEALRTRLEKTRKRGRYSSFQSPKSINSTSASSKQ